MFFQIQNRYCFYPTSCDRHVMLSSLLLLLPIAVLTGIIVGLSGGSGVMVVVPLLTILLDFSIYSAIGTSLLVDVLASIIATIIYYRHGNVDLSEGGWIVLGALLGAILGSLLAVNLPEQGVGTFFGLILILMGISTWRRGLRNVGNGDRSSVFDRINRPLYRNLVAFILGGYAGISAGLAGAGGGGTIFIILVFVFDYPIQKAVGTSTLIMIITALTASFNYIIAGHIDFLVVLVLGVVATITSLLTSRYANRIEEKKASLLIATLFLVMGIFMLLLQLLAG